MMDVPEGLGDSGAALWAWTVDRFKFDQPDAELLKTACRTLDVIDALEAEVVAAGAMIEGSRGQDVLHPAIAEARLQRQRFAALVAQLGIRDGEGGQVVPMRGRQGAQARWGA